MTDPTLFVCDQCGRGVMVRPIHLAEDVVAHLMPTCNRHANQPFMRRADPSTVRPPADNPSHAEDGPDTGGTSAHN